MYHIHAGWGPERYHSSATAIGDHVSNPRALDCHLIKRVVHSLLHSFQDVRFDGIYLKGSLKLVSAWDTYLVACGLLAEVGLVYASRELVTEVGCCTLHDVAIVSDVGASQRTVGRAMQFLKATDKFGVHFSYFIVLRKFECTNGLWLPTDDLLVVPARRFLCVVPYVPLPGGFRIWEPFFWDAIARASSKQ